MYEAKRRLETNFDRISLVVTRIAWAPIQTMALIVWGLWTIHLKLSFKCFKFLPYGIWMMMPSSQGCYEDYMRLNMKFLA